MLSALQTKDAEAAGWFGRARLRLNFMGNITTKVATLSSTFCKFLKGKGICFGEARSLRSEAVEKDTAPRQASIQVEECDERRESPPL